jgi:hypothetical protein
MPLTRRPSLPTASFARTNFDGAGFGVNGILFGRAGVFRKIAKRKQRNRRSEIFVSGVYDRLRIAVHRMIDHGENAPADRSRASASLPTVCFAPHAEHSARERFARVTRRNTLPLDASRANGAQIHAAERFAALIAGETAWFNVGNAYAAGSARGKTPRSK